MEAYTDFAGVYDIFMDDTPYEAWADFLVSLIEKYGISAPIASSSKMEERCAGHMEEKREEILKSERNLVLDLGCGTGTLTELLYKRGYDVIGVDNSEDMLNIALAKREKTGSGILYLCQDMRELDLYSTVGTVVCVCDSINYLLEDEEVEDTFSLVHNYLYPGGIFIFDFNTVYKYEKVIGDTTIAENRETCSFIWENYYHEQERVNEYDLTIFAREDSGLFRRFSETHFQRGYTLSEMTAFVKKAGMEVVLVLDADTHKEPGEDSERIYVVARECGKIV
ncbi:dTDP-3-amino-3,4,6-trideoxy-alpha-D-glucopyranose [Muribaculaceae bacterium]|nr:class I SAM-dependent methyltransferase [Lachnospiraceae bacterium]GFI02233.1 dTDP-3-amino-3,4,6-trideoxy-alpha-D-glucopyranose [Lachnospiraceae bacterium]GFI57018.1 dTDP-3-amino-3,4,6-trideoxy-alpha-D-glucopyranose [Muribaculaceae bacterium]